MRKKIKLIFILFAILGTITLVFRIKPIFAYKSRSVNNFKYIPKIKPFTQIPRPTKKPKKHVPTATVTPSPTTLPTPTPLSPIIIVFADNRPHSFNTEYVSIPPGYKSMTLNVSTTGSLINWAMGVQLGGVNLHQHRFNCSGFLNCPEVTIPIIDDAYLFSTGSGSGNITATATLNPEPSSQSLLLGGNVSLPFVSAPFDTTGFNSIIITAGQLGSEHLTGISLQRLENGDFVEKQHVNCDGGAECPVATLPIIGGNYRVVLEGSGTNAVLGALLRQ